MAASLYDESQCIAACGHVAREIVRPLVRRYFGDEPVTVERKHDRSVVTGADREIEARIRSFLADRFPRYGLLGEEYGGERTDAEYVWTIDPIDGTEAFVAGLPLFGTLLAVVRQRDGIRQPLLGALYLPVQDQLVIGNRARTTLEGRPITMSRAPADVLLLGNVTECAKHLAPSQWAGLRRLATRYRATHTWGDCLGYLSLLTGKAQARIEFRLGVDDVAPLEPIVLGAGGVVSCSNGTSLSDALSSLNDLSDHASFGIVCAASREAHEDILRDLAG